MAEHRKIKVGMVGGGGPGNFFGGPHRTAIIMDNSAELTAGALRSTAQGSIDEAKRLFFTRGYPDYQTMMTEEAKLPLGERIDYVTIVTPNHQHFGPAKLALENGFGVLCEKPLTLTLEESQELAALTKSTGLPFIVAYTYTGFPMVMLAKEMVQQGDLGEIRKVEGWYPQGWLAGRTEDAGVQQAEWRVDPSKSGASGCGGDIGTHAYEFVRFVAGLTATEVSGRLHTFVQNRKLDDDFSVFARLNNGGIATVTASQVTIGSLNDNGFRVIGTKGTAHWNITDHLQLYVRKDGQPEQVYRLGGDAMPDSISPYLRLPGMHPEGFHEALANLHKSIQLSLRAKNGESVPTPFKHPDVVDGAAGMAFLEASVESSNNDGAWTKVVQVD
jgi:predicted dehydrogenase